MAASMHYRMACRNFAISLVQFLRHKGLMGTGQDTKTQAEAAPRAPLRWAGSKRKSLPALRRWLPREIDTYIEPFAGSACLAFALKPQRTVLGDLNSQLVEFYTFLQDDPERLHRVYEGISRDPETYYSVRNEYNQEEPSIDRAAKFLYLNRNCFNGIYRVNTKGKFNVPWGGDKVGHPLSREDIVSASQRLLGAEIECDDFESVVRKHADSRSFVYLDPPFAADEVRVFREYHERSFATSDWGRLVATLRHLDSIGARFLMSYAGDASLPNQFNEWNVGYLDVTRNVGGFKSSRRKYREFIATNYKIEQ